jgi:hypothetical protein
MLKAKYVKGQAELEHKLTTSTSITAVIMQIQNILEIHDINQPTILVVTKVTRNLSAEMLNQIV